MAGRMAQHALSGARLRQKALVLVGAFTAVFAACAALSNALPEEAGRIRQVSFAPYEGVVTNLHVAVAHGSEYLEFDFVIRAAKGSETLCRMSLPPADKWDGRLWGHGHGGYAGNVYTMPAPSGPAKVTCDVGMGRATDHRSHAPRRVNEEEWKDFGWRATHLMTVFAKKFCEAYYGKAPHHSYFTGGSTGGGQALHEVTRFPEDYDGVVATVPAQGRIALEASLFHRYQLLNENGRPILPTNQLQIVSDAAIAVMKNRDESYCSGRYLSDPRECEPFEEEIFDYAAKKDPVFANPDIRRRLHEIYAGPVVGGRRVHHGYPYGARITHAPGHFCYHMHLEGVKGAPAPGKSSWDDFLAFAKARSGDLDATDPDLRKFAARGGKIISFVGYEDQTVPFSAALQHWEDVAALFGSDEKARDFYRLYMLPGAAHGGIGRAIKDLPGGYSRIVDWVEKGIPPEDIELKTLFGDKIRVAPYPDKAYCGKDGVWRRKAASRIIRRADPFR